MQLDNKRILSSLITTILIISIIAIPAPYVEADANENIISEISPAKGPIGLSVTVKGTTEETISETSPVKIYWASTEPTAQTAEYGYGYGVPTDLNWKLLATVKSPVEGQTVEYNVKVTVPNVPKPEDSTVDYYIVAWQDVNDNGKVDGNEWDSESFTVEANINPTEGKVGSKILVGGWASPGSPVEVYWDYVKDENLLTTTYAKGDASFTCTVKVPESIYGTHYIIVKDASTNQIVFTKSFKVKSNIKLSSTTALAGDIITVDGTGFAATKKVTLTLYNDTHIWIQGTNLTVTPTTVKTDDKGSFNCTFKVPSKVLYGKSYTVKAEDEAGNSATATLKIGATITLSPTSGPTGTVVTITGRGFTGLTGVEVSITMGSKTCKTVDKIKVKSDGTFKGEFAVPTLSKDEYTVTATANTKSATAKFKVTKTTSIKVSPTSGAPDSNVTIEGVNFAAIADVEVTIKFGDIKAATTKTNSTGGFKTTVTVPPLPVGTTYDVKATDKYGLTATAKFRVALTALSLSPSSGSTGSKVLLVGGGLTPNKKFNVTINGKLMKIIAGSDTLDGNGNIQSGTKVLVPTLPVGTYTITVMDKTGVTATASFAVTKTTEIVLTPSSAPKTYDVTIKLNYFTAEAGTTITLTIYNVTAEGDIYWQKDLWSYITAATGYKKEETNAKGSFKGTFTVPTSFMLGDYYINATDANGLTAQASFSIVKPTVIIYTGADEYMPGDTVAFFAKCTFKETEHKVINLYTPEKFKIEISIPKIDTKLGDYYTGTASYILPSDAKLGTWTWNATIRGVTVKGTFTVVEKPTVITIREEITRLKEDVASLASTVDDLSSIVESQAVDIDTLSQSVSDLKDSVSDLSTALSSLTEDVANLTTAVENAQSAAEAASEAAEAAQGATSAISTAVYGAVILSLIAAVAAIMALITLQRKIAG